MRSFRVFLLLILCARALFAAAPRLVGDGGSRYLDLNTAVAIALRSNFALAIRHLEKFAVLQEVQIARAEFDPLLVGRYLRENDQRPQGLTTGDVTGYSAVLSQKTPLGTVVELSSAFTRTVGDFGFGAGDFYESETQLTLRQPLLRGFGFDVNRSQILLKELGVDVSEYDVRAAVLSLLRDVEVAYWEVVFAYREKRVRDQVVAVAERLLSEANSRGRVGLASGVEPLQAQAALAARREDVITAQQAIDDRMDRLMYLLGKIGTQERYEISPGVAIPFVTNPRVNETKVLEMLQSQPEYQQRDSFVAIRRTIYNRARRDALPSLDLRAGTGLYGIGNSYSGAFDEAFRRNKAEIHILLEMRVPLFLREERATARLRHAELQVEELRKKEVEQLLRADIQQTARAVVTGNARVEATSESLRLSNEQFEQVSAKFGEGLTTFREMLLAQSDLQEAGIRAERAKLDAVVAGIRLARFDGTLLARYGLKWTEPVTATRKAR